MEYVLFGLKIQRRLIFRAFRDAKVQKSTKEFLHGLDFRLFAVQDGQAVYFFA